MLRGIRTASANWLGRIVMGVVLGLIAVSFAIWGIGDIFRGFGRTTVAKIGGTEITIDQFRQIYNDRLQQYSRQLGRPLASDQARALGLDRQILSQILAETALDERAKSLRLGLSDDEVARRVMSEPVFRGIGGQFERARFEQMIRQAGYSEPRYIAEQRRVSIRRQLTSSVSGELIVPDIARTVIYQYENEQRNVEYILLTAANAGDIPAPTPEALAKYFDDNKTLFRAPEYRKIAILRLTAQEIAEGVEVSDADAKRYYDDHRTRFVTPERRHLQQIVFATMADAKKGAEAIAAGADFTAVATQRGMNDSDIDLGLVTRDGVLDRAVANAAFALTDGAVSAPVEGRFGVVLVRVTKIEPEKVRSFADVSAEIKRSIATERAKTSLSSLHDKIEDERAAGLRLDEVAAKVGLKARTIEAIDRSGRDADGNPVADLPAGVDVVSNAYASDVGVENDPLQPQGGGYVWYEVAKIMPSHERPLAQVRERVEARWRDLEIAKRLKERGDALLEKLRGGSGMHDLAGVEGLKVETAAWIKRRGSSALPAPAINAAFATAKDAYAVAEGKEATQRIVLKVTDVTLPLLDKAGADAKRIDDSLRNALADDLLAQYLAHIETELGTSINQNALNQATGAAAAEN
ncbi:MAG: SurA N-terminal domain-containing protein [Proteobacteria bacterium]|nr:SurA N-terminal domain-containing protein [Pseudomonadota bacterium]